MPTRVNFLDLIYSIVSIPLLFLYYTIYVVLTIIYRVFLLVVLLIQNLPLLLILGAIVAFGVAWYGYHDEILTKVDIFVRCDFQTWYNTYWRQLIDTAANLWEQIVCWVNAVSHWNRFFTGYFLAREFAECAATAAESTGGYYKTLKAIFIGAANMVKIIIVWLIGGGLFGDVLPIYNILLQTLPSFAEIDAFFNCVCNDIRPLFDFVIRVVTDQALFCTFHYYVNSVLTVIQQLLTYGFNFVLQLFVIIFGGGTFDDLVQLLFREATSLGLPDLTFASERGLSGAINLGMYLDNILLIVGCTIASEIDGGSDMDVTIIYPAYQSCYDNKLYHVPFFSTVASVWAIVIFPNWNIPSMLSLSSLVTSFNLTPGIGYRALVLFYGLIVNWFREWDPTQQFLKTDIAIDRLLDSIRDPPLRMNETSTIWSNLPDATLLAQYDSFGIPVPPVIDPVLLMTNAQNLYGGNYNGYAPLNTTNTPSCVSEYPAFNSNLTSVPCVECNNYGNYSIQYRLCNLGQILDNLVFGQTGASPLSTDQQRQIFQPILCCIVGRIIRLAVAIANYPIGLIRNWTDLNFFLEDDRYINSIFDELGGMENEFGGVIRCLYDLFYFTLDPNLACFVGLVAYPAKALSELLRSMLLMFPRLVATINGSSSKQSQNLSTYVCLDSVSIECFGIESGIQWLRPPRQLPVSNYTSQFNATVAYQPVLPANSTLLNTDETFVDCLCFIINLKFISNFLPPKPNGDPQDILDGVDICCGIRYAFRAVAELIKFVFELLIVIMQTFYGYILGTEGQTFLFLEWLSCSPANLDPVGTITTSDFYCTNLVALMSDLQDFLDCPCTFFLDIEVIIMNATGSPSEGIQCLCELLTGVVGIVLALIRFAMAFVLGLIKVVSCLIKEGGSLDTIDCQDDLSARFLESFAYIDTAFNQVQIAFSGIGCLIGSLFGFSNGGYCLDNTVPPCPIGGNNTGPRCFVADKLGNVFFDLAGMVVSVGEALINVVIGLLKATLTGASSMGVIPTSFVQFIENIVDGITVNAWGDPTLTPPSNGFLQDFGIFLTCAFGPGGCNLGAISNMNPNAACSGTLFIVIGDEIQGIWGNPNVSGLSCVIFQLLFFIETLFLQTQDDYCQVFTYDNTCPGMCGGGPGCAQAHIKQFIICLFKLIFNLLFTPGFDIVDFFFQILGAIAGLISSGLENFINLIGHFVDFLVKALLTFVEGLICFFTTGKITTSCDATAGSKKRGADGDDSFSGGASGYFTAFVKEKVNYAKRMVFQNAQTPNFNETETGIITNPADFLSSLDNTSFCSRALNRSLTKYVNATFDGSDPSATLEEELIIKVCYGLAVAPSYYNAMSRDYASTVNNNPDSLNNLLGLSPINAGKRDTGQTNIDDYTPIEYQFSSIPYDALVNPVVGLTLAQNMIGGFGHYLNWIQKPVGQSIYYPTEKTYTTELTVDDFSAPVNISDPSTIEALISGGNGNKKRQPATVDMIESYMYQGVSFSDYLQAQGITCHYTESFFRSLDVSNVKTQALTLVNLRAGIISTIVNTVPLTSKRFLGDGNIQKRQVDLPTIARSVPNRILNIGKSYTMAFVKQYRAYKGVMQSMRTIYDGKIANIMIDNNFSVSYFHTGPFYKNTQPNLIGDRPTTILGPKEEEYEKPPIFLIKKRNLYKRSVENFGSDDYEIRIPVFTMVSYLYRNVLLFGRRYMDRGMERMKENYKNRTIDHWSKFRREYVYEKAIQSPNPTSLERAYTYIKSVAKERNHGTEPTWSMDEFMEQIAIGRRLNTKKRFGTNLGCKILDDFITNTVNIFDYCGQRYVHYPNGSVEYNVSYTANFMRYQTIPTDIVPYNASNVSSIVSSVPFIGTIYGWIGYDVVQSASNMVNNFNLDPRTGNVGIYYFLGHIPVVGVCIRGVDDTCTYGMGIGRALLWGIILVGVLIVLYIVVQPLGSMLVNVVVFLGGFYFILSIVLTLAYGYNMACLDPGGSTLLFGYIIPITLALPTLPECAGADVAQFFDDLANAPCGLTESIGSLMINGSCVSCNSSGGSVFRSSPDEFENCQQFSFPTFTSVIANDLYTNFPSVTMFLNNTCWVRGGCLQPSTRTNLANYQYYHLAKVTGVLSFLIPSNSYINTINNGTSTANLQNQTCLSILWPTRIAWYLIIAFVLFMIGYVVFPVLGTLLWASTLMIYNVARLFYILAIKKAS